LAFKIYPFIMCGGAGTRLWPMSTRKQPKQFHNIVSNLSMLQETAMRGEAVEAIDIAPPSFVCSSAHKDLVLSQCEAIGIKPHMVILEPMAKNTAAVAANQSRKIIEFVEKPDIETAQSYLKSGDYYWNAGIFLFMPSVVEEAFASYSVDILEGVKKTVAESKQDGNVLYLDAASFDKCRSESFDYAIMEMNPYL